MDVQKIKSESIIKQIVEIFQRSSSVEEQRAEKYGKNSIIERQF